MNKKLKSWSPELLNIFYSLTLGGEYREHFSHKITPALFRLGNALDMERVWSKLENIQNIRNISGKEAQMLAVGEVYEIINRIFFNTRELIPQDKKKKIEQIDKQINKLILLIFTDVEAYKIALEQDLIDQLRKYQKLQNTYDEYKANYIQSDRATLIRELYTCFYKIYGTYLSDCVVDCTNAILNIELSIEDITPYKPKEENS